MSDSARDDAVERALALDRIGVARLIRAFEDQRPGAGERRAALIAQLDQHPKHRHAAFIGITGTPGSGKSTLVGELSRRLLKSDAELRVAVLAVDPSSHVSGGSLLGDRTRVRTETDDARFFFRSQASQTELGGLSPASFQVCRLLERVYDLVFVETVGIGQSEVDIRYLADRVYLVLQPLGGDEVQFLKAGVMEIPDAIILNKADAAEATRASFHALKSSLTLARPFDAEEVVVHRTSARTGEGLDELATLMRAVKPGAPGDKEAYFFQKWVRQEWGRRGIAHLGRVSGGAPGYIAEQGGYDAALSAFGADFVRALTAAQP